MKAIKKPNHVATTSTFWLPGGIYKKDVCRKCGMELTCHDFWHTNCSFIKTILFLLKEWLGSRSFGLRRTLRYY